MQKKLAYMKKMKQDRADASSKVTFNIDMQ